MDTVTANHSDSDILFSCSGCIYAVVHAFNNQKLHF